MEAVTFMASLILIYLLLFWKHLCKRYEEEVRKMSGPIKKPEKIIKQEEGDENSNLNASTSDKVVNLLTPWQIRTIEMGVAVEVEETQSSFKQK